MEAIEHVRLAVVDDDVILLEILRDKLIGEGYQVATFSDATQFLTHVQHHGLPHLALIDLSLPQMDGFALSERLKSLGDVPIIFISGQRKPETVVKGLKLYADDYIRKPFDINELVVRVYRVLSRISGFDYAESRIIQVDDWLAVDFGQGILCAGDEKITLTPIEANILYILVRNAGQIVTSRFLLNRVWPLQDVYEETLRVHMHRLRRKVEPDYRQPRYIQTVRGVGYRFEMPSTPNDGTSEPGDSLDRNVPHRVR